MEHKPEWCKHVELQWKNGRVWTLSAALAALAVAGCRLFEYPHPFDNPIDPDLSYGGTSTVGEPEYGDRRGIRQPQDLTVHPNGGSLILVPNGYDGLALVDTSTGRGPTWLQTRRYQYVQADPAHGALYAASWDGIVRVDMETGGETVIVNEQREEGWIDYQGLGLTPDGDLASLRVEGWPISDTTWSYSYGIRVYSPDGSVLASASIPDGCNSVAASQTRLFYTSGGVVYILNRNTGTPFGTISWDPDLSQFTRLLSPSTPRNEFGADDLHYDTQTGNLLVSTWFTSPGTPTCYIMDPEAPLPLVAQLGDSTLLSSSMITMGADGTVYACSREGLVFDLTNGRKLFENPARRDSEYRDITDLVVGPGGVVYLLDRGLRRVKTYDPATEAFGMFALPTSEPGWADRPLRMDVVAGGLAVSDRGAVATYTTAGVFVEEWGLTGGDVRDLDFLPDGSLLAVLHAPVRLFHLVPGDPTVYGPLGVLGLPTPTPSLTTGSLEVDTQGRIHFAASGDGLAFLGRMTLVGTMLEYEGAWSSAEDAFFRSGVVDNGRYRVEGVAVGPECVWVGFSRLNARVRFSLDGAVLGSLGIQDQGTRWSPDSIAVLGDDGDWEHFAAFAVDDSGRMWMRRDERHVLVVTPQ